jgi:mRNA interferase MazF
MIKDFNLWNKNKQDIHYGSGNKFYHQREVWWCSLGVNIGFEQDGKGITQERPVLIIKGFNRYICIVVPLTTVIKDNPYYIPLGKICNKNSFAIISQIRLIDTKRLVNKIGIIDKKLFSSVRKAVKDIL